MSWVDRYLTVFSLEASNGNNIDRICDVSRVLGVSGKAWVSSLSSPAKIVASASNYHHG